MAARLAGSAVALLLLASCDAMCGSSPRPAASLQHNINCVDASAPHHAYVVVQHSSGAWIERCVGFAPGFIDLPTLMSRAGIQYQADGSGVAAVDDEPAAATAGQMRWVLFIANATRWTLSHQAFADVRVTDAQTAGWRYVSAADANPAPPPFPHTL